MKEQGAGVDMISLVQSEMEEMEPSCQCSAYGPYAIQIATIAAIVAIAVIAAINEGLEGSMALFSGSANQCRHGHYWKVAQSRDTRFQCS